MTDKTVPTAEGAKAGDGGVVAADDHHEVIYIHHPKIAGRARAVTRGAHKATWLKRGWTEGPGDAKSEASDHPLLGDLVAAAPTPAKAPR